MQPENEKDLVKNEEELEKDNDSMIIENENEKKEDFVDIILSPKKSIDEEKEYHLNDTDNEIEKKDDSFVDIILSPKKTLEEQRDKNDTANEIDCLIIPNINKEKKDSFVEIILSPKNEFKEEEKVKDKKNEENEIDCLILPKIDERKGSFVEIILSPKNQVKKEIKKNDETIEKENTKPFLKKITDMFVFKEDASSSKDPLKDFVSRDLNEEVIFFQKIFSPVAKVVDNIIFPEKKKIDFLKQKISETFSSIFNSANNFKDERSNLKEVSSKINSDEQKEKNVIVQEI